MAGHALKPYVDYGSYNDRIRWYTMVREPKSRSYSQFYQDRDLGRIAKDVSYSEWSRIPHLGMQNRNAQCRQIAGVESAAAAIDIIKSKKMYVGVMEDFGISLIGLREYMGESELSIGYGKPKNVRSSSGKQYTDLEAIDDQLTEENFEDLLLYKYVCENLFEDQLSQMGGRAYLNSMIDEVSTNDINRRKLYFNRIFRNFVYKHYVAIGF